MIKVSNLFTRDCYLFQAYTPQIQSPFTHYQHLHPDKHQGLTLSEITYLYSYFKLYTLCDNGKNYDHNMDIVNQYNSTCYKLTTYFIPISKNKYYKIDPIE